MLGFGEGGEEHSRHGEKARHGEVGECFGGGTGGRPRVAPELPRPEGRRLAGLALVSGWVGSAPAWSPRRWQLAPAAPSCFRASASFPCTDHRCVSEEAATDFSSNPWTPPPTAGPAPGPPQRLQVILCTAAQGTHGRGTGTAPPPQQTKPALRTWVQARP